jgi:hypothetical protein
MIGKSLSAIGGTKGAVSPGGRRNLARPPRQAGKNLSKNDFFKLFGRSGGRRG